MEADMASAWQTLEEAALTLGISSRTLARRLARSEFETRLENGRREVLVVIPEPEPLAAPIAAPAPAAANPVSEPQSVSDGVAAMSDTSYAEAFQAHLQNRTQSSPDSEMSAEVSDEVQSTMLALHEDRIRRTDLAIMAYQQSVNVTAADARRTHRNLRVAWGLAGGMAAALFVAVVWATHSVTKAQAEVQNLNQAVRQLSDTADTRSREIDRLREKAQEAQIAAARAEGLMAAAQVGHEMVATSKIAPEALTPVVGQPATQPASATTQPASAMQALMQRVTMQ
jgi:hypothetical protein